MRRVEKEKENALVISAWDAFVKDTENVNLSDFRHLRLRSCKAEVSLVGKWLVLYSYRTIVAIINRDTRTLYDVLR